MAKAITIADLYSVSENRFKQTKTYQSASPLDSRWQLVESPSESAFIFTNSFWSYEVNLSPTPIIILTESKRIEIPGVLVTQKHIVGTKTVKDPSQLERRVEPEIDSYTGQISRYWQRFERVEKSHEEQYDYMWYTIAYNFSKSVLKQFASAASVEILLHNKELSQEECVNIQMGAKLLCQLAKICSFEEDIKSFVGNYNKKVRQEEKRQKREEQRQRAEELKKQKEEEEAEQAAMEEAQRRARNRKIKVFICILAFIGGVIMVFVGLLAFIGIIEWEDYHLKLILYGLGLLLVISCALGWILN